MSRDYKVDKWNPAASEAYWAHSCKGCPTEDHCYRVDFCEKQNCHLDQVKRPLPKITDEMIKAAIDIYDDIEADRIIKKWEQSNDASI